MSIERLPYAVKLKNAVCNSLLDQEIEMQYRPGKNVSSILLPGLLVLALSATSCTTPRSRRDIASADFSSESLSIFGATESNSSSFVITGKFEPIDPNAVHDSSSVFGESAKHFDSYVRAFVERVASGGLSRSAALYKITDYYQVLRDFPEQLDAIETVWREHSEAALRVAARTLIEAKSAEEHLGLLGDLPSRIREGVSELDLLILDRRFNPKTSRTEAEVAEKTLNLLALLRDLHKTGELTSIQTLKAFDWISKLLYVAQNPRGIGPSLGIGAKMKIRQRMNEITRQIRKNHTIFSFWVGSSQIPRDALADPESLRMLIDILQRNPYPTLLNTPAHVSLLASVALRKQLESASGEGEGHEIHWTYPVPSGDRTQYIDLRTWLLNSHGSIQSLEQGSGPREKEYFPELDDPFERAQQLGLILPRLN